MNGDPTNSSTIKQMEPLVQSSSSPVDVRTDNLNSPSENNGKRRRKLPARFRDRNFTHDRRIPLPRHHNDTLPESLPPIPPPSDPCPQRHLPRVILIVRDTIRTALNGFGLMREYPHRPSYDPDAIVHAAELATRRPAEEEPVSEILVPETAHPPPWPHKNMTHWHFMSWLLNGNHSKSQAEASKLINIAKREDFDPMELKTLNVQQEMRRIDEVVREREKVAATEGGDEWQSASIELEVPTGIRGSGTASFTVPGLRFRSLIGVITAGFQDPIARYFHLTPFKKFRQLTSGVFERVWDELYNSDVWLREHDSLQRLPSPDGLEKVIVALMFWSDATQLAQFGTAKAWPLYLSFGNLSKYIRGQPRTCVAHHVAYIPSVSQCFSVLNHFSDSTLC